MTPSGKSSEQSSNFAVPQVTFEKLISESRLEPSFLRSVRNIDYTSPVTKINVAVNKLPNFKADPNMRGEEPMPHHRLVSEFFHNFSHGCSFSKVLSICNFIFPSIHQVYHSSQLRELPDAGRRVPRRPEGEGLKQDKLVTTSIMHTLYIMYECLPELFYHH